MSNADNEAVRGGPHKTNRPIDSATSVGEARDILLADLDDLDTELTNYRCRTCQEECINPLTSLPAERDQCVICVAHAVVHGHYRRRIAQRW
jgi:hypothetical protein